MGKTLITIGFCVLLTFPLFSCNSNSQSNQEVKEMKLIDFMPGLENLNLEDITSVRLEKNNDGLTPGALNEIQYAINYEDISLMYDQLDVKITESNEKVTPGLGNYEYTFITKEKAYTYVVYQNGLVESGTKTYKVEKMVSNFNDPSLICYSLEAYTDDYKIITKEQEVAYEGHNLNDLEFVSIDNEAYENQDYIYLLTSEFLELEVYSASVIKIEDMYYELTKEYKLFE